MAEPINLNRARKARAAVEAKSQAAENRIRFGRTKGQKAADDLAAERSAKLLDGKLRDPE